MRVRCCSVPLTRRSCGLASADNDYLASFAVDAADDAPAANISMWPPFNEDVTNYFVNVTSEPSPNPITLVLLSRKFNELASWAITEVSLPHLRPIR